MLDTSRVEARLAAARAHADGIGLRAQLDKQLDYLATYAHPKETRCTLFLDYAPHSFSFEMEVKGEDGVWRRWFSGGLIYHGLHDGHGSGEPPALAVTLTPMSGWHIHT